VYLHYVVKLETQKLHLFTECCVLLCLQTHQNYHLVIDKLSFFHKTINRIHQTWHKVSSYLICTRSAFTISAMILDATSVMGVFSANIESQRTLSVGYFTTHYDKFFFSRTAHWHIMHATESNCRRANSQLHCWAVKLNTVIKRSEAH